MPVTPKHPWVVVAELGDVTLAHFTEPRIISELEIKGIGDALLSLPDKPERKKIVVSLAGVEVMSSSMVGKLIALQRKCKGAGARLVLCGIQPGLERVFEIGGLRRVFTLAPDQASAILALASPEPTP